MFADFLEGFKMLLVKTWDVGCCDSSVDVRYECSCKHENFNLKNFGNVNRRSTD